MGMKFDLAVEAIRVEIAERAKDCQKNLISIAEAVLAIEEAVGRRVAEISSDRVTFRILRKGATPIYDLYIADMAEGLYRCRRIGAYPDSDEHPNYLDAEEWDHERHGCTPEEFAAVLARAVKRALTSKQKIAADLTKTAAILS